MWSAGRFYWPLIKRAFVIFFARTDVGQNVIGVVLYLLTFVTLLNQQIGKAVLRTWEGFPAWYGVIPLALLFVYGFLQATYEAHQTNEDNLARATTTLREYEEQRLDLVFDITDSSCVMTFDDGEQVLYRVGVVNLGGRTIDGVKVTLRRFAPQNAPFLPAELRLMHRTRAESIAGVSLNRGTGPGLYVNVVSRRMLYVDDPIELRYASEDLPNEIPPNTYDFTLRVEGQGIVRECERTFTVKAAGQTLEFYPR